MLFDQEQDVLSIRKDIAWLPKPNECRTVLASQLPPLELVKTALAVVFLGDQFLVTNLVSRGWDIPGGHVEAGEHPEETVRREVYEETGAELGPVRLLAYQRLRLFGPKPASYRYPYPDSYQVFYTAQVSVLHDFCATAETSGRDLLPPDAARSLAWVQHNRELYEIALKSTQ